MRERIEVAGKIDAVISDFTRLFNEYEKLGHEIINMDVMPHNMFSSANHEGAIGLRRVRAALSKPFDKIVPQTLFDEMKWENLATTEARQWSLPPDASETKAA